MDRKPQPQCGRVVIFNHLEGYFNFLRHSDADEAQAFRIWANHGDRSLFWLGDSKLVITSYPIPDADLTCQQWGYSETKVAAPEHPSSQLSLDILHEDHLVRAVLDQAGNDGVIELIPYVATPSFYQLVSELENSYRLEVHLPESPAYENLWLQEYIDTKSGFRHLALQWLGRPELLPEGYILPDVHHAGPVINRFLSMGMSCVVKSSQGVNGMGNLVFDNECALDLGEISRLLHEHRFFQDDQVVVERFIPSPDKSFPSVEIFVPPVMRGAPMITYLSQQLFDINGHFGGIWVGKELIEAPWYPDLARSGRLIGERLQAMGYVGHFDLDAIVDEAGSLYLLEVNARRTGGTHVHEFAREKIGPSYLESSVLLDYGHFPCGPLRGFLELKSYLGDLFFPANAEMRGLVVSSISNFQQGTMGCIFIGKSLEEARSIEQIVKRRLAEIAPPKDKKT